MRSLLFILLFSGLLACSNSSKSSNDKNSTGLRIVSLAPSVTQDLLHMGVKDQIVGVTSYCVLAGSNPEMVVGSAIDINIEKILLLKPDVVIATGLTKTENIETLTQNGVKVYQLGKLDSYKKICDEFVNIANMVNKKEFAENIVAETDRKIDSLRNTVETTDSLSLFFQIGVKPLFAVIPNTFMDDLIRFAKCKNITYDMHHGTVSRETVINRNPDVIYVATMGIVGNEEKALWESYTDLNAVKNKRVFIVDSNTACTPSLRSFYKTFEQMVHQIYQ